MLLIQGRYCGALIRFNALLMNVPDNVGIAGGAVLIATHQSIVKKPTIASYQAQTKGKLQAVIISKWIATIVPCINNSIMFLYRREKYFKDICNDVKYTYVKMTSGS